MADGQRRAKAGGEFGANGEWYEGGKFIATTDHVKLPPVKWEPSLAATAEALAREERSRRVAAPADAASVTVWRMTPPTFPPNRIIREGEDICPICGSGRRSHQDGSRGHAMPVTLLTRLVRWIKGI